MVPVETEYLEDNELILLSRLDLRRRGSKGRPRGYGWRRRLLSCGVEADSRKKLIKKK